MSLPVAVRPIDVDAIVDAVAREYATFGGGRVDGSDYNPLVAALKNEPPMFAMGVDVKSVVLTVLHRYLDQVEHKEGAK